MYEGFGVTLVFLFFLIIVLLVFSFIAYLCMAIGVYNIAVKSGLKKPWIAFIPIANHYLLGKLSITNTDETKDLVITHMGWVSLLISGVLHGIESESLFILLLIVIVDIALVAIQLYYMNRISKLLGANAALNMVLSIIGLGSFVYLYLGLKKEIPTVEVINDPKDREE